MLQIFENILTLGISVFLPFVKIFEPLFIFPEGYLSLSDVTKIAIKNDIGKIPIKREKKSTLKIWSGEKKCYITAYIIDFVFLETEKVPGHVC